MTHSHGRAPPHADPRICQSSPSDWRPRWGAGRRVFFFRTSVLGRPRPVSRVVCCRRSHGEVDTAGEDAAGENAAAGKTAAGNPALLWQARRPRPHPRGRDRRSLRRVLRPRSRPGLRSRPGPRDRRIPLGRRGEWLAAWVLRLSGARVIGRNVRTPYGEIDLLAIEGGGRRTLLVVEVKTRRDERPLELSARQMGRIARAAQFLHARYQAVGKTPVGVRIDRIDVRLPRRWLPWPRPFPRVRRLRGAWGAERAGGRW